MSITTAKIIVVTTYALMGAAFGYSNHVSKTLDRQHAALKESIAHNDKIMNRYIAKPTR